jgi:chromosome segregation ATPase
MDQNSLLHQVVATLEGHITDFAGEAEARVSECQKVFDGTVSELSEKLAALESTLQEKEQELQTAKASNSSLTDQLAQAKDQLNNAKTENARVLTENDGLRGQVARMEKEHKTAVQSLQTENKELVQQHAQERSRISDGHASALTDQRKELTEVAEQAENRLMMMLDQERQKAKTSASKLSDDLAQMTQQYQSSREAIAALETTVKELSKQSEKLGSHLASQAEIGSALQADLEAQRGGLIL